MSLQHRLHLARVNVLAVADDHVVEVDERRRLGIG
jgi:hypothetical protein